MSILEDRLRVSWLLDYFTFRGIRRRWMKNQFSVLFWKQIKELPLKKLHLV